MAKMAKIVCVLYDDPIDGYPKSYARDDIPKITIRAARRRRPRRRSISSPARCSAASQANSACGNISNGRPHTRRDLRQRRRGSVLEQELPDAEIVISQPFWPAYMTAERIAKAHKAKDRRSRPASAPITPTCKLRWTAAITVAEVTYCNSISVAEHVVMMILALVRNYIPSYSWVVKGGWNIADCVERSYDVEGMHVGTVAAGRIGLAVLRRLKPFDMHCTISTGIVCPEAVEKELNLTHHPSVEWLVKVCDVVTINARCIPKPRTCSTTN